MKLTIVFLKRRLILLKMDVLQGPAKGRPNEDLLPYKLDSLPTALLVSFLLADK